MNSKEKVSDMQRCAHPYIWHFIYSIYLFFDQYHEADASHIPRSKLSLCIFLTAVFHPVLPAIQAAPFNIFWER